MALSRTEIIPGLHTPSRERTGSSHAQPAPKYTQTEIDGFMFISPPELTPDNPVSNPVGTWTMREREVIFTPIPQQQIDNMTKIDLRTKATTIWERSKQFAIKVGRLS